MAEVKKSPNIKDERAHRLAAQIALLTGESLTQVGIEALQIRLDQERGKALQRPTAEEIIEFGRWFAKCLAPGMTSAGHADLYGPDGLPR